DERDLPVQPEPPDTLGAAQRRLDAADHRRARHAGAEGIVLQARPFCGHLPGGSDLSRERRYGRMGRAKRNPSIASTDMGFASLYPSYNSARPHSEALSQTRAPRV